MDLTDLKGIISLMQRTDLTELEIEVQDLKLRLARPNANSQASLTQIPVAHLPPTPAATEKLNPNENLQAKDNQNLFKSPMVGTFYRRPGPEEPSYVEVGSKVKAGDVLCIIEAMKVMNEIKADTAGTIDEILHEDGDTVEYGQPLFRIT
ncbi:MAG: acetyl-CoA carboxylase biotin carboxyl carrier protein [Opitutae bacterium]|nr:acetyl-CoA carboxylase biotin carboxyl carrier protein [Opitutae bacterium]MBT7924635.1 acetyl-CoA carboxylase biotin carboxyl carrier protein [Opitutae bacterium]